MYSINFQRIKLFQSFTNVYDETVIDKIGNQPKFIVALIPVFYGINIFAYYSLVQ